MGMILRSAVVTDLGLVRTNNEDSAHAGRRLVALADGMGGLPAGELASDIVIRTLTPLEESAERGAALPALRAAVFDANRRVRDKAETDPAFEGMGTTVTALLLRRDRLALVHVGDSRCYRLRDGSTQQVTRDDTYVQSLVDRGVLALDEVRRHPQRSLVTRAVQGDSRLALTATELKPRTGDRYMLCSDGLSDFVDDDAIAGAMRAHREPLECAERLVKLALQAGGHDNVTVVVADIAAE
jgi:protein phosphatase